MKNQGAPADEANSFLRSWLQDNPDSSRLMRHVAEQLLAHSTAMASVWHRVGPGLAHNVLIAAITALHETEKEAQRAPVKTERKRAKDLLEACAALLEAIEHGGLGERMSVQVPTRGGPTDGQPILVAVTGAPFDGGIALIDVLIELAYYAENDLRAADNRLVAKNRGRLREAAFVRALHDSLGMWNIHLPNSHLATIAGAILESDEDDPITEARVKDILDGWRQ